MTICRNNDWVGVVECGVAEAMPEGVEWFFGHEAVGASLHAVVFEVWQLINLKKGENRDVKFELGKEAFSFYNPESGEVGTIPGDYLIFVGGSSDNTIKVSCRR